MAVANNVTCSQLRVACCVELLHSVSLPWSKVVTDLVHECLVLDTGNAEELRSLYDLLQLKSMLHESYGIIDFNFSDSSTGQVSGLSKLSFHSLSLSLSLLPAFSSTSDTCCCRGKLVC